MCASTAGRSAATNASSSRPAVSARSRCGTGRYRRGAPIPTDPAGEALPGPRRNCGRAECRFGCPSFDVCIEPANHTSRRGASDAQSVCGLVQFHRRCRSGAQ
jgi:hypothetical protein